MSFDYRAARLVVTIPKASSPDEIAAARALVSSVQIVAYQPTGQAPPIAPLSSPRKRRRPRK